MAVRKRPVGGYARGWGWVVKVDAKSQLPTSINCPMCNGLASLYIDAYRCHRGCGVRLKVTNPATWLKWITEYEASEEQYAPPHPEHTAGEAQGGKP